MDRTSIMYADDVSEMVSISLFDSVLNHVHDHQVELLVSGWVKVRNSERVCVFSTR
jgi:hypothetical protein